jgi:hypothetical protein
MGERICKIGLTLYQFFSNGSRNISEAEIYRVLILIAQPYF